MESEYLTSQEIAFKLRISNRTVTRWFKSGRFHPSLKIGKTNGGWRIKTTDFEEFIKSNTN